MEEVNKRIQHVISTGAITLNLYHNQLTTLPENIFFLISLQVLSISRNQLGNLPKNIITPLINLEHFYT